MFIVKKSKPCGVASLIWAVACAASGAPESSAPKDEATVTVLCCAAKDDVRDDGRTSYRGCKIHTGGIEACAADAEGGVFVECRNARCDDDQGCTCDRPGAAP